MLLGGAGMLVLALSTPTRRASISEYAVPLTAAVAVGAMAGSLYFSEVADFVPCELCWFQRIAMYPIAILGTAAALRRDRGLLPYVAVLAGLGLAVSLYHTGLQLWPDQSSFCEVTNPCTGRWVEAFGWMTIPQMTAVSFALIGTIAALGIRQAPPEES